MNKNSLRLLKVGTIKWEPFLSLHKFRSKVYSSGVKVQLTFSQTLMLQFSVLALASIKQYSYFIFSLAIGSLGFRHSFVKYSLFPSSIFSEFLFAKFHALHILPDFDQNWFPWYELFLSLQFGG